MDKVYPERGGCLEEGLSQWIVNGHIEKGYGSFPY